MPGNDKTALVNGTSQVIGQQYKLVLSNFEKTRTSINFEREFSDWSGTVKIKIAEGAAKDISNNNSKEATITGSSK